MATTLPRDVNDLYLAPVVLAVDARIGHLGGLDQDELAREIAVVTERFTWDAPSREAALIIAVAAVVDLHGWALSWDARGIRLTHGVHSIVLGVPPSLTEYVAGTGAPATAHSPDGTTAHA